MESAFLIKLIALAVAALVGAVFVRVATRIAAGFTPPYWTAYIAAFFGYVAVLLLEFFLQLAIGQLGQTRVNEAVILNIFLGFIIQSAVYASLLKHPETGKLSYQKACFVSLIYAVMTTIVFGVIALAVMFVVS